MDSSSIFEGKVYVFRIKATNANDWNAPDVVYGLAQEGVGVMTFSMFKELAMKNKKHFLTKKANPKWDQCSVADIQRTLRDWKVIGNPKLTFLDKPASWLDIASATYSAGVFNDADGANDLETLTEENKAATDGKVPSVRTSSSNDPGKPATSNAALLAKARSQAEALAASGCHASFTQGLTQAEQLLANPGFSIDKFDRDELLKVVEDYKVRVLLVDEKCAALENTIAQKDSTIGQKDCKIQTLEEKVKSLKHDLVASKKVQTVFMAAADMKALEADIMKKTTTSLVESLRPMIVAELQPLKTSLDATSSSLQAIKSSCDGISTLQDSVVQLASATDGQANAVLSQIETCDEATQEILKSIQENLANSNTTKVSDLTTTTGSGISMPFPGPVQKITAATTNEPSCSIVFPPNMFTTPPPKIFGQGVGRGSGHDRGRGAAIGVGRGRGGNVVPGGAGEDGSRKSKKRHQRQKMQEKKKLKKLAEKSPLFSNSEANVADTVESLQQQLAQLQQYVQAQGQQ